MSFFIAEVSSNHSRDLKRALRFIDIAADIGCDSVKFQLFKVTELFSSEILENSEDHRQRAQWELPLDFLPLISERCKEREIQFSCTPFYLEAVTELEPFVDFYKISSYELLWDDLLVKCALSKKPVILSTGMATLEEILHATKVLKQNKCKELTLLHCNSAYPTPPEESNLSAIDTLRTATGCEVGWSDHTVSPGVIYRAIHKWNANIIEFHLDLDKQGEEYQSGHCWLPDQIKPVIQSIKTGFEADGEGIKKPSTSESKDRDWRADPLDGLRPLKKIRKDFK